MGFESEIDAASIVLVGDFNPPIFHPDWFRSHGLIRDSEADAAQKRDNFVIAGKLANFKAGPFELQVTQDRFMARVADSPNFPLLRDLAVGTFGLLEHTPVRLLGLNRMIHYSLGSEEQWHEVGDTLAPKDPWNGVMEEPGMMNVHMQGPGRVDFAEHFRVKIQPSRQTAHGVYFDCNEQYNAELLTDDEAVTLPAGEFVDIIDREWEEALEHEERACITLLENIVGGDEP